MNVAVDLERRRILLTAMSAVGGVVIAAATYPFLASMSPSERAQAAGAPVTVDLLKLEPGKQMTVDWRGKPVWILRRTREMIEALQQSKLLAQLSDPNSRIEHQPPYAANAHRSIKPEYSILVTICTHLGCVPALRPEVAPLDLGLIGWAATSAPATARNSIWQAGCSRACPRRPISSSRRTDI